MNQKTIFLLSIIAPFISATLLGNNNPVLVTTVKNNTSVEVSMNLEINGTIKLYSVRQEDAEEEIERQKPTNDMALMNWVLDPDKDFYIGLGDEVEAITPSNFKRLAKKYFVAIPELTQRIGKRGFRYKNLPSIILFYNKMIAKKGGLTKTDMMLVNN